MWTKIWDFVKNNKIVWLVVGALMLFGGGLAVGRYTLPPSTIVTEKIHEVVVEKVVEKVKTEVKVVTIHDAQEQQKIHRTIVEGIDPPGCKSKTTTEDIGINTVVHDNTNSTQIQYVDRVIERWQDKIVEKETRVLTQPNWSVYAGVGIDIPFYLGNGQNGVPGMKGLVVQAGVDRRILGPAWVGVFGNTEGIVGANLRFSW
jgi:hypothetical protein